MMHAGLRGFLKEAVLRCGTGLPRSVPEPDVVAEEQKQKECQGEDRKDQKPGANRSPDDHPPLLRAEVAPGARIGLPVSRRFRRIRLAYSPSFFSASSAAAGPELTTTIAGFSRREPHW